MEAINKVKLLEWLKQQISKHQKANDIFQEREDIVAIGQSKIFAYEMAIDEIESGTFDIIPTDEEPGIVAGYNFKLAEKETEIKRLEKHIETIERKGYV